MRAPTVCDDRQSSENPDAEGPESRGGRMARFLLQQDRPGAQDDAVYCGKTEMMATIPAIKFGEQERELELSPQEKDYGDERACTKCRRARLFRDFSCQTSMHFYESLDATASVTKDRQCWPSVATSSSVARRPSLHLRSSLKESEQVTSNSLHLN